jgi:hypothetical protein
MFSKKDSSPMTKAEPNLAAVNHLIRTELPADTVDTIDVEHALAVLRSENARLRDRAGADAKVAAQKEEDHKRDTANWRKENLKLQEQLLAAQQRVYELQAKLLSLREIANGA